MEITKTDLENLSLKADLIIHKYSLLAGLSGVIPGADFWGDTACQLFMVHELQDVYQIKISIIDPKILLGVVSDNFIGQKTVSKIASVLKVIPLIGNILGSITKYLIDFFTTMCIGKVCKLIFEYMYIHNVQPNKDTVIGFASTAFDSTLAFVKANWKSLISTEKYLLPKYEIDLRKLASDFKDVSMQNQDEYQKFAEAYKETQEEISKMTDQSEKGLLSLEELCNILMVPSMDLLIAEIKLKQMNKLQISIDELVLIDLCDNKNNTINKFLK
jgi:uncharacterized protein (DUF697 family)